MLALWPIVLTYLKSRNYIVTFILLLKHSINCIYLKIPEEYYVIILEFVRFRIRCTSYRIGLWTTITETTQTFLLQIYGHGAGWAVANVPIYPYILYVVPELMDLMYHVMYSYNTFIMRNYLSLCAPFLFRKLNNSKPSMCMNILQRQAHCTTSFSRTIGLALHCTFAYIIVIY